MREACSVADAIGHPPVLWRAQSLLGELAERGGAPERGRELRARARRLAEGLASGLADADLRGALARVAARLESDPLQAYR